MKSSSPLLCLVHFATAHEDQHAPCVTLLDLLLLFYFKSSISPNSQSFIISIVCTLSHFRPRRGFCLSYSKLIPRACREACTEGRLQMLRALYCRCEPAPLPDASSLWFTPSSTFPLHCPGQREVHKGNKQPLGEYGKGKKVKVPPGSTPAMHFTMYVSRDRSRKVEKGSTGGECHHQPYSLKPSLMFNFQKMSCSSTLILKSSLLFVI